MIAGVKSNIKLGSFVLTGGVGWNPGSRRNCRISPCSIEVFLSFDFGGFAESEESLCFPKDGSFGTERNLASFAGKADEAQLTLSSEQAFAASLIKRKLKESIRNL